MELLEAPHRKMISRSLWKNFRIYHFHETNVVLAGTPRTCLLSLNLGQSTEKLEEM